jgi:hypothetical protein
LKHVKVSLLHSVWQLLPLRSRLSGDGIWDEAGWVAREKRRSYLELVRANFGGGSLQILGDQPYLQVIRFDILILVVVERHGVMMLHC